MSELTNGRANVPLAFMAIVVGNTNTRFAFFSGKNLTDSGRVGNAELNEVAKRAKAFRGDISGGHSAIVIASDNDPILQKLIGELEDAGISDPYLIGRDLDIPIECALDADATPGQDRLLNALAAWSVMDQACVVVDTGTAITVDFVDGEGVFQGGVIAAGATLSLKALHQGTAALPELSLSDVPEGLVFGKNTRQAMLSGVLWAARGLVEKMVERYALEYGAYPPVVATGSDAELLMNGQPVIDRIVPNLTLLGIELACRRALSTDSQVEE